MVRCYRKLDVVWEYLSLNAAKKEKGAYVLVSNEMFRQKKKKGQWGNHFHQGFHNFIVESSL